MTCPKICLTWIFAFFLVLPGVLSLEITTPAAGDRYSDVEVSVYVNASGNMTNCTYSFNEFVPEDCTFNTTLNATAFFGWNRMEACGNLPNGTSVCDSLNFWSDKQDKEVSDYFVMLALVSLGLFLGMYGLFRFGIMGVLGGVLILVACLESVSLGINIVPYALFLLGVSVLLGSVVKR